MGNTNRSGGTRAVILAHIDRGKRRTVATLIARVVVDHGDCDGRQTALDFGGPDDCRVCREGVDQNEVLARLVGKAALLAHVDSEASR